MPDDAPPLGTRCALHDWETLRTELAFIYDSEIPAGKADRTGGREREFSAWLVRRGTAWIESDGERAEARAGQWLVCFGREVTQRFSPDAHLLSLRVLQSWPDGSALFEDGNVTVLEASRYPQLERHASRLLALSEKFGWNEDHERDMRMVFHWRNQMDYPTYMDYNRHLHAWQVALAKALIAEGRRIHVPESSDPRLARALQVIDAQSPGAVYPEEHLVRFSGLSTGRLNRLCAQAYGFTMHQYWERRRLECARMSLATHSTPIKQVAFELGFSQLSHFSAWFKRHAGMSPRAYQVEGKKARG